MGKPHMGYKLVRRLNVIVESMLQKKTMEIDIWALAKLIYTSQALKAKTSVPLAVDYLSQHGITTTALTEEMMTEINAFLRGEGKGFMLDLSHKCIKKSPKQGRLSIAEARAKEAEEKKQGKQKANAKDKKPTLSAKGKKVGRPSKAELAQRAALEQKAELDANTKKATLTYSGKDLDKPVQKQAPRTIEQELMQERLAKAKKLCDELNAEKTGAHADKTDEEKLPAKRDFDDSPYSDKELSKYMEELSVKPLLTFEEEQRLAKLVQEGDEYAREELIMSNLRLVISIAKKYTNVNHKFDFLDLVQYGNMGLITAVDKFDPSKGNKFSTYAVHWIRQGILRGINNEGRTIRLAAHMYERWASLNKAIAFIRSPQYNPSYAEICRVCRAQNITFMGQEVTPEAIEKLYDAMGLNYGLFSLDMPMFEDEETPFETSVPDTHTNVEKEAMESMKRTDLADVLGTVLSSREKSIVIKRFGLDGNRAKNLYEISDEMDISVERVRQLEQDAYSKIRNSPYAYKLLKGWLR